MRTLAFAGAGLRVVSSALRVPGLWPIGGRVPDAVFTVRLRSPVARGHRSMSHQGQHHLETSAAFHLIRCMDRPAKLMCNLVADRQAEARSLARRLGGKERFEYPPQ